MPEGIDSLKANIDRQGGTFAGRKLGNELLRDLAHGTRFTLRPMTEIEDGVTAEALIAEYDGDLRLPFKACVFEVPYIGMRAPCVLIARQEGVGIKVTGFQFAENIWCYTGLSVMVRCDIHRPGVRTTVMKTQGCKNAAIASTWLTKMLLFALGQVHQRPTAGTADQSARPAVTHAPTQVPPLPVPTHSHSTVTIGGHAAGNAERRSPQSCRKGTPKREHERRGHWRVYKKSGKRVWIGAQMVGHRSMGTVQHEYHVI